MCVEHGYGEKQDLELLLDPDTLTWKSVKPWNPKTNQTQADLILNHLYVAGPSRIPAIASALKLNLNYVITALWRLQSQDMTWKEPGKKNYPGIYHLTDKARDPFLAHDLDYISKTLDCKAMIGEQNAHLASIMRELEG